MTFDDILEQVIILLKRQGRVSYGAIKRRFELDDAYLEDLKGEILYVHPVIDDEGRGLIWIGETEATPVTTSQSNQPEPQPVFEQVQPVQEPSSPVEHHTPDAERRQLTVMFCDLVESTALSGQLDPEDYREVVRQYQQVCSEVIQRYDGHIAQYLGDGLLVYFGYPVAHEDDAQRAIHSGLGIVKAIDDLNSRLEQDKGVELAVRLGIHTGLVVVGEMGGEGRQEQLALGETPNVASRIQGLAEANSVVISDSTYRLIQGYFDCQELGEQTLRGVSQPIVVYRVFQESGAQSRLDIARTRGLTPLVGREQEVELLLERWEQAKDRQGQVILLSGEAGIGKSRLVQVLKEHVAEEPHTRWECRSSPYYQNTALYPLIDLLQRALQWQQDDTAKGKLEKLEQELSQYRLSLEETIPLFAPLLSLPIPEDTYPPLNVSPQRQRQKTLESILAILLELAEREPVLFILEDLHWTDPTTLEFLSLLVEQVPTTSLCALLTCRPHFQPSWHHRSYLTEITVNRLSREQIERMAERVAGGKTLPGEVLQQLVERTDGVPLYVEEMTKAVLESGVLKEVDGHYELIGSVASLAIPATLQDSLMARLDRLVAAKAVAQYGSVIGRQFSYELLQAVSELDEAMLQHELRRLVEAELVYQRGLPPQAVYTFKHALIQDTAYESLLRGTRQGYHRRIAEALTERFPETAEAQPELLAHHYTEADLSEDAVRYWNKAGQLAIEHSAYVEAVNHLQRGLALLQTAPSLPACDQWELDLQIKLGSVFSALKGYGAPEVEHAYARAHELCQQVGDTPQLFLALRGLENFYLVRGQVYRARELAEQLLHLAQRGQDPAHVSLSHMALGGVLYWLGENESALANLEQGVALCDGQPRRSSLVVHDTGVGCLMLSARTLWHLGFPDRALARAREAIALAQALTHPYNIVWSQSHLISLYVARREMSEALQIAESTSRAASEHSFSILGAIGTCHQEWLLSMQGEGREELIQLQHAIADMKSSGEFILSYYRALMAERYCIIGKTEEGLVELAEALTLVDETGARFYEAELRRLKGQLLLQQSPDNATEAESCFQQAITIAQNQSAKSWELRSATSLARLWRSQGKRDEAYDLLAPVYNWFTEGFDTADLKDAKALLDELQE